MSGLYVHIPFCKKKCDYCDFASYTGCENLTDRYVDAVLDEARQYPRQTVQTVFFGGGTPSLLSDICFTRLFEGLKQCFDICADAEITVECNPESVTEQKLLAYKACGVNRISVGLQSAKNDELAMLGRLHDYNGFLRAYGLVRRYFDNVNIDVISGLPGQTKQSFIYTLNRVIQLKPEHISAYSLIVEDGTPLKARIASGALAMPDEDEDRAIYHATKEVLLPEYSRYEISNYCMPGRECRHNLGYWLGTDYIGLGCAAHSLYRGKRYSNTADLQSYLRNEGRMEGCQTLTVRDKKEEFIMLRLRLVRGFELNEYRALFGTGFMEDNSAAVKELCGLKLLEISGGSVRLTDAGLDVADSVMLKLL